MSNHCLFIGSNLFFGDDNSNSPVPRMVEARWLNLLERVGDCYYFDVEVDNDHGLVFADDAWLVALRLRLIELGFSPEVANKIQYSQEGLQRYDYVHLYCNHPDFMNALRGCERFHEGGFE